MGVDNYHYVLDMDTDVGAYIHTNIYIERERARERQKETSGAVGIISNIILRPISLRPRRPEAAKEDPL